MNGYSFRLTDSSFPESGIAGDPYSLYRPMRLTIVICDECRNEALAGTGFRHRKTCSQYGENTRRALPVRDKLVTITATYPDIERALIEGQTF